ncbi:ABC transporter substrate-binding protein [Phytoactinopolyspora alkaliphila]|uniref:ABC transporter substrate-binding protein n=1 Tax=Phytoactinopolyspora alkaliphila TaxID=1783498 RepID=A0A6N9YSH3_9ACTN|nr:ABC transporter substrate-binding protein [Phytoactinopolyspora alkaliphila]NED97924.1 ABC transporter substrate-binding protein [Phytoactinopolyspora alkaliphila]
MKGEVIMKSTTRIRRHEAFVAAATALVIVGCSQGTSNSPGNDESDAADATGRDTLEVAIAQEPTDLVPYTAGQQGKSMTFDLVFMPLLYTDDENEVQSDILESWELDDSATTVTLRLRDNLTWSDGEQLTSADVVMTLTQALDPNISIMAGPMAGVVGTDEFAEGAANEISGLSAPDEKSVVIDLADPDATWLPNLVLRKLPILPQHILGEVPHDELAEHEFFRTVPVSSGPYTLKEHQSGQYLEFEKNMEWQPGAAFDRVTFRVVSVDVMSAQLETGEIQFMFSIDPTDVERVGALESIEVESTSGIAPGVWAIQHFEPLLDPQVRQAMAYAIDREAICDAVYKGYCETPIANIRQLGPEWAIPEDDVTEYRYNPERARQLLDEAGWDSDTELTFLLFAHVTGAPKRAIEIAQGNMADVGINWSIETIDVAEFLDRAAEEPDSFHGFYTAGADFTVDPSSVEAYTSCESHYPNGSNIIRYCNEELDDHWRTGRRESSAEKRAAVYQRAFRLLNEEVPEIYLLVPDSIIAYDSRLKGVRVHSNKDMQFWNIGEWTWEE